MTPANRIAQLEAELAEARKDRDAQKKTKDANGVVLAATLLAVDRITEERDDEKRAHARTQADTAAMRISLTTIAEGACDLKYIGTGEYISDGKCADIASAALRGDAGRALAERVTLWRELEDESREWNLASMCICHLSKDPQFRCLACRVHTTTLCKLSALDEEKP